MNKITLSIFVLFLTISCSSGNRPSSVYSNWCQAWKEHHGKEIFRLTSEKNNKINSPEDYKRLSREKVRRCVKIAGKAKYIYSAELDIEGTSVKLINSSDGWKFTGIPFPEYRNSTPEDTVKSFVRALKFQRVDIISSLLIEEYRVSISPVELAKIFSLKNPRIKSLLSQLEKAKDQIIFINESTAILPYSDVSSLKMKRINDGWFIADPD
ncbi:MAG: hypothetical protein JXR95_00825 [Deltaproteobacteria bacterium]|nr:hypothetical protein [Deltaproteobacteria bacterium]